MTVRSLGLIEYETQNPQRSPRWRYERARYLVDHRPRPLSCVRGDDDVWIRKCRSYLLNHSACARGVIDPARIEARRRNLCVKFPALHNAYLLFNSDTGIVRPTSRSFEDTSTSGAGHQRYALEARILAGQTNNEIAKACQIIPGIAEYYERLFFNVRDRLGARDYIVGQIITPIHNIGLGEINLEISAKFFGYFGGPVVLEFVLNQFDIATLRPKSSKQLEGFFDGFFSKTIRRRAAEAAAILEVNRFNVMQLFEIHSMLIAEARLRDRDLGNAGQYEENMRLLLSSVPWSVGRDSRKAISESPVGEYLKGSYELRASEMAGFTGGSKPKGFIAQDTPPNRHPRQEVKHDDEEAL